MLRFWMWLAACVLVVSLCAHLSTYVLRDPRESIPGVMFIHVAIFPPFGAAITYGRRIFGTDKEALERNRKQAPRWLRGLTSLCMAYAVVNFVVFLIRTEGGSASQSQGKYLLKNHGHLIRELTEDEFHQHQANVVRGFSGHWMLFSSLAVTGLVGCVRMRARPGVTATDVAQTEPSP